MNRRTFIQTGGLGAMTLYFGRDIIFAGQPATSEDAFIPSVPDFKIHANGAFDIIFQGLTLKNCFPGFGMTTVYPQQINVDIANNIITYHLQEGEISISLKQQKDTLVVSTGLIGFKQAPDWFNPVSNALLTGADRFFKQGFGFAGPSGLYPFPEPKKKMELAILKENVWSYNSYLTTAFVDEQNNTLALAAFDHSQYLHRSRMFNQQSRFGLIDRHMDSDQVYFETGFATESINISGETLTLPDIHFFAGNIPFETLRNLAELIAMNNDASVTKKPRYHWCSWYEYGKDFSGAHLRDLLNGLKDINPELPVQTIQIDDGYFRAYGDWLVPAKHWPEGIEKNINKIIKAGYQAGVWIGPFMVSSKSDVYKNHKDWLLKDSDGKIIIEWKKETENVCVLDSSHPDAFEYLRKVFRTHREWGVTYYKTDFMDWGYRDSNKVQRYRPGKTSAQYFNEVVKMIREEIGEDSFWLGCISPYQPMIGYVDSIRISNDVHPNWSDEGVGNMFRQTYAEQYFNNVFWQNDPDVLYLREEDNKLTEEETLSVALWNGFLGGVVNTSDRFHTLSEEKLKLWRFLQPGEQLYTATLPNWYDDGPLKIATRFYEKLNAWAILMFNHKQDTTEDMAEIKKLIPLKEAYCYYWKPGKFEKLGKKDFLNIKLKKHESVLFYVTTSKQTPPDNLGLSGILITGL